DSMNGFPTQAQSRPASRQHLEMRADVQERLGQRGAGVRQMLAVVQNQQQALVSQMLDERLREGAARLFAQSQRGPRLLGNQPLVPQRPQLHQKDAIGELFQQFGGGLQGQSRLAHASRAGQGDAGDRVQQSPYLLYLSFPADERGQVLGQVVG